MPYLAHSCGYTPDEIYDMPMGALVLLTIVADDQIEKAKEANDPDTTQQTQYRRMR